MVYDGRVVGADELAELAELNEDGLAMIAVHNRELSCQGVALYFDTEGEADSYGRQFAVRQSARVANGEPAGTDPCADYRDTPNFTPDRP